MKYLLSLSACAGLYLSVAGIFFVGAFAYAQNLNHFQKDYEKFFKNISSTPSFPSQVSNESITNEKYKVFEFALPYLSRTDKENVKLCSRELNDCVKENDDVFEVNSSNINQVTEAFPVEKIRINSLFSSSQEINESLSRLKRLTAIEMNLSISRSVNIWEIDSTIRQKITHLTCYEQQIINLPSDERLIYFPQLTHLTIIDPTGEENSRRNNFICIRTGLPVLRCLVLKQSSENIYNPFSPELKLECPDALTELKLIGLENVRELPNFPRNLAFLFISNLSNVKAIPDLYRYKNLRSLTLRNLPRLQCIAGLLTYYYNCKLRSLTLRNLPQLQCIPSFLRDYYNFSSLTLCNLPQLQAAPELPRNLDHIFLHDIGKLNITVRSI
jgi:hypothetical protein